LGEVEDQSSRAGGDGRRPATLVKSAVAAVASAREKEREKEREEDEADAGFKYELVAPI
jgi:hypothetical protein